MPSKPLLQDFTGYDVESSMEEDGSEPGGRGRGGGLMESRSFRDDCACGTDEGIPIDRNVDEPGTGTTECEWPFSIGSMLCTPSNSWLLAVFPSASRPRWRTQSRRIAGRFAALRCGRRCGYQTQYSIPSSHIDKEYPQLLQKVADDVAMCVGFCLKITELRGTLSRRKSADKFIFDLPAAGFLGTQWPSTHFAPAPPTPRRIRLPVNSKRTGGKTLNGFFFSPRTPFPKVGRLLARLAWGSGEGALSGLKVSVIPAGGYALSVAGYEPRIYGTGYPDRGSRWSGRG